MVHQYKKSCIQYKCKAKVVRCHTSGESALIEILKEKSMNGYLVIFLLILYYLIIRFGGRPRIGRKETGFYEIIYGTYGRVYQLCI